MGAEQLRIAMLSVHSSPVGQLGTKDTGGMSVYVQELARELGKRGHRVDVFTRAHDQVDDRIVTLGKGARVIHLGAGEAAGMHKLAIYSHLDDFASNLEAFRRRSGIGYDLIHSHYWLSGWAGRWLQRWWGVPHVTMFHTLGAAKNGTGVGEREPELRIRIEENLVRNCHRTIAATKRERDELINLYDAPAESISVIPCGVNLDLFQPVDKRKARRQLGLDGNGVVLFVGRMEPSKGIDRLLMAMTRLEQKLDVRLVIVGGDGPGEPEADRLRRLSRELGIEDSVTFVGTISQKELPLYYSAADACAIPSYYESFGLVALEALACGTPLVATRVGCIESVVREGESGCVVADNSPRRLADAIGALLSKADAGAETATSIRATVTAFSWANIAAAMIEEYESVIADYRAKAG